MKRHKMCLGIGKSPKDEIIKTKKSNQMENYFKGPVKEAG